MAGGHCLLARRVQMHRELNGDSEPVKLLCDGYGQ